jgi:hypothetical protein
MSREQLLTMEKKPAAPAPHYFHIHVGDVDAKVKIVAVGQPSEAVSVFCTQAGYGLHAWDAGAEARAQNLLECIRQTFPSEEFKAIPLMANNCAGIKIHRAYTGYSASRGKGATRPSGQSMDIFNSICQLLERLADNPEEIYHSTGRFSRNSFHNRVSEQALRNEITRILSANAQVDFKVSSLVRLMDRQH